MDKRILTPEELEQMKTFIVSRSQRFAEPLVLLEIIDHFACKTEELLHEDPTLPFATALQKAHHSFGVKGFAPIATACEKRLYGQYKRAHQEAQRKLLFSPHGLGLLATGLLVSQLDYRLPRLGISFLDGPGVIFLLEILFRLGILFIWFRQKAARKQHPLVFEKAYEASSSILDWLWLGLILAPLHDHFSSLYPVFTGCLAFLLSLQLLALYRLYRKVEADIAAILQRIPPGQ